MQSSTARQISVITRRTMPAPAEPNLRKVLPPMNEQEILQQKLASLRIEHRDLDDVIARIGEQAPYDQLQLQRLKKRKLALKDQIARMESRLLPDIIA
jgi:hypothetical protein